MSGQYLLGTIVQDLRGLRWILQTPVQDSVSKIQGNGYRGIAFSVKKQGSAPYLMEHSVMACSLPRQIYLCGWESGNCVKILETANMFLPCSPGIRIAVKDPSVTFYCTSIDRFPSTLHKWAAEKSIASLFVFPWIQQVGAQVFFPFRPSEWNAASTFVVQEAETSSFSFLFAILYRHKNAFLLKNKKSSL